MITREATLSEQDIFFVSGGARGITAHCVRELARRFRCGFVLLGRSALAEAEPAWSSGCADAAELKRRAAQHLREQGQELTPSAVQLLSAAVLAQREISATLRELIELGSRAIYVSGDISDAESLARLIAAAQEQLGPITGVIHGAGTLADKRVEHKTERDFEQVFGAKVGGLAALLRCLEPDQLRWFVLFSSTAGFYGNAGQTDYAMANEALNKAAHLLKRRHPGCRVCAINWGPWEGGMVTPELARLFTQRGVELIPLADGARLLADQLVAAPDSAVQVVVGGELAPARQPLGTELRTRRIRRTIRLSDNPALFDHMIAGRAVLPVTCMIAWIATSCEGLYPGYRFFRYTDARVLKGIVLGAEEQELECALELREVAKSEGEQIELEARIVSRLDSERPHFHLRLQITLVREIPPAPTIALDLSAGPVAWSRQPYQDWFIAYGPAFRGVTELLALDERGLIVRCLVPPSDGRAQGQFPVGATNPYTADVSTHCILIWLAELHGQSCLPSASQQYEQYARIPHGQEYFVTLELVRKTATGVTFHIITSDASGRVYTRSRFNEGTIVQRPQLAEQSVADMEWVQEGRR